MQAVAFGSVQQIIFDERFAVCFIVRTDAQFGTPCCRFPLFTSGSVLALFRPVSE